MSVVLSDLSFNWPNGRAILRDLSASFGPGRTGLIGVNGSGKSTLLRLIAGELRPSSGSVTVDGDVGYLPQDLTLDTDAPVASLLGIAAARDAIAAIERGDASEAAFEAVGDDWDVEERALGWLSRLGLAHVGLDDRVGRLSGGETIMTALAALFLRRPAVIALDEPTNNLDLDARRRLRLAVESWPGVMLIVSHDRELLGLVDQIADLSDGSLRMYGGNLAAYEAMREGEQAAALRAVSAAEADVRREKRDLVSSETKQARRDRHGPAGRGVGQHPAHRRGRAQARGPGDGRAEPGRAPGADRGRPVPAGRGGRGGARRRHDPDSAAGDGGARRADGAVRFRAGRGVASASGQPGARTRSAS